MSKSNTDEATLTLKSEGSDMVLRFRGTVEIGIILGNLNLLGKNMRLYDADGHEVSLDYEIDSDDGDFTFEIRTEDNSVTNSKTVH